jgi:ribonuclease P protein component
MLSKANRLSVKEFDLVVKTGRESHSPFFTIKYIPASDFKFSPTAPKRIFKTAVSRNLIRRRVYGAVRDILKTTKIKPNCIVLIIKKDIADMDSPHLVRALQELLFKLGNIIDSELKNL